jgi:serine phosphatase RsbU (regulator of sigma subunit)
MAYLKIITEQCESSELQMHGALIRAGRSSNNDLVLADAAASREHFELHRRGDDYVIRDLGSRNGTFLNGLLIHQELKLRSGDEIQVGRTRLVFCRDETTPAVLEAQQPDSATIMYRADQLASSLRVDPGEKAGRGSREDAFVLNQLAAEVMPVSEEPVLLNLVTKRLLSIFKADRCAVVYQGEGGEHDIEVKAISCTSPDQSREVTISSTAARHVIKERMALQISDVQADDRFMHQQSILLHRIGSILCAPLWHDQTVFGLLYVDTTGRAGGYVKRHLALLSAVANLVAMKIDNLRLFELTVAKARMEKELSLAAQIQARMLPQGKLCHSGITCVGFNRPCYEVGGDYYDYAPMENGCLAVTVADVSGKGASAAMLMASCKSMLTAFVETGLSLLERVSRLGRYVLSNSTANKFVTFFHAEVDPVANRLRYCNAGHNPPLLLQPGAEPQMLEATGTVLGIMDYPYEEAEVPFGAGSFLVAYSDGVTEARNYDSEEYGEQRLFDLLGQVSGDLSPEELRDELLSDVEAFVGGPPSHDDVTVVIIKREQEP